MNADHKDTLVNCLARASIAIEADMLRLCGVDASGMDIAVGALIHRITFSRPVTEPNALRQRLAEMANGG